MSPSEQTRRIALSAPDDVLWIARTLDAEGFDTWAVGGAVRDALAGGSPDEWDMTTAARPRDVQRIFRRTIPVGVDHGTVGVLGNTGRLVEVTTFRKDVENFGRRARVAFADHLEDDLDRRDFTINAIAWHPLTHELRDPHGGEDDLQRGVLRTVGDAGQRFEEDRLRVLRALRFAGRFDLQIVDATWAAVCESSDKLGNLSAERIRDELWKVLSAARPSRSLDLYRRSGVLTALLGDHPEWMDESSWRMRMAILDRICSARPAARMAVLLHRIDDRDGEENTHGAAVYAVMRRLKASNADSDRVTHLATEMTRMPPAGIGIPGLVRWYRRVGSKYLLDLVRIAVATVRQSGQGADSLAANLWRLRGALRAGAIVEIGQLAINGGDLRRMGVRPGPVYSELLEEALEWVTERPEDNRKEFLLGRIAERFDSNE